VSALITDAIDEAVAGLAPVIGAKAACRAVGLPRASYYLARPVVHQQALQGEPDDRPRRRSHRVRDEGVYLCSQATMYRLLREGGETGDRRRHATHPAKVKPELVADAPNRVLSVVDPVARTEHQS